MDYDAVFDALDKMIVKENGVITVSDYGFAVEDPYDLFERLNEDGFANSIRDDRYLVTDKGRSYHAEGLEGDVLDVLAEEGTSSVTEISTALGYDGCGHHTPRHDCAINAVRKALRGLIGDARVGSTAEWNYKLSSREREKRKTSQ